MSKYVSKRSLIGRLRQKIRSKILLSCIKKSMSDQNRKRLLNILEIGPGYGDLAREFEVPFEVNTYSFLDLSPDVLDFLKSRFKDHKNNQFISHDANYSLSRLSLMKQQIIISSHVIEHLESPSKHLEDIYNHLDDDGIAIISTPNLDSIDAITLDLDWRGYKDNTHISLMGYAGLKDKLIRNRFEIIRSGTSPRFFREILFQKNLDTFFFSKFHLGDSSNFIVQKRKG